MCRKIEKNVLKKSDRNVLPTHYSVADAGTSAIKVCAFDAQGTLLKKVQRFVPVITPYPLWVEIDLERYWELLLEALQEITAQVGAEAGLGLSFLLSCVSFARGSESL